MPCARSLESRRAASPPSPASRARPARQPSLASRSFFKNPRLRGFLHFIDRSVRNARCVLRSRHLPSSDRPPPIPAPSQACTGDNAPAYRRCRKARRERPPPPQPSPACGGGSKALHSVLPLAGEGAQPFSVDRDTTRAHTAHGSRVFPPPHAGEGAQPFSVDRDTTRAHTAHGSRVFPPPLAGEVDAQRAAGGGVFEHRCARIALVMCEHRRPALRDIGHTDAITSARRDLARRQCPLWPSAAASPARGRTSNWTCCAGACSKCSVASTVAPARSGSTGSMNIRW